MKLVKFAHKREIFSIETKQSPSFSMSLSHLSAIPGIRSRIDEVVDAWNAMSKKFALRSEFVQLIIIRWIEESRSLVRKIDRQTIESKNDSKNDQHGPQSRSTRRAYRLMYRHLAEFRRIAELRRLSVETPSRVFVSFDKYAYTFIYAHIRARAHVSGV